MILGFDIGGTKCAVVSGEVKDGEITVVSKKVFPTVYPDGAYAFIDFLMDEGKKLCGNPASVGISCGGPLSSEKGIIMSPPNLPGWDNIPVVEIAEKKFGCKAFLQNDANASAVAEWKFGAGRGCKNMIFLTFGTGFGAGLILDGRLYEGTNGNAGEIGHVRLEKDGPEGYGKRGSAEGFCSGGGIKKLADGMGAHSFPHTAKDIALAAENGDKDALLIYEDSGRHLGAALSVLVDILNPERIIIGSIYTRSEKLLKKAMMEELKREALPSSLECCEILSSKLGESIGDYACLAVALL